MAHISSTTAQPATRTMKNISKLDFEQMEKLLIKKAKEWISGRNFESTISTDNTPFEQFDGFRARAIFKGDWLFDVQVRQGYKPFPNTSLAKALELAQNEKAKWLEDHKRESTNLHTQ